jgi:hypothetical protein
MTNIMHRDFTAANDSAFHWWTAVSKVMGCSPGGDPACATRINGSGYNDGLIYYAPNFASNGNQNLYLTKRFYAMGQYSRFVRPGSVRHDVAGAPAGVQIMATARDGNWTLVVNNLNTTAQEVDVRFPTNIEAVSAWRTSATENLAPVTLPTVTPATAALNLPPRTISTYVLRQTAGTPPTPPPPPPAGGQLIGVGSNRCLTAPAGSTVNGMQTTIADCARGAGQQWAATAAGELRVHGNKCLDAEGQSTAAGTRAIVWDCTGASNQRWTLNTDGTVRGQQSGLCLDVSGGATANGSPVILWTCSGAPNQRWQEALQGQRGRAKAHRIVGDLAQEQVGGLTGTGQGLTGHHMAYLGQEMPAEPGRYPAPDDHQFGVGDVDQVGDAGTEVACGLGDHLRRDRIADLHGAGQMRDGGGLVIRVQQRAGRGELAQVLHDPRATHVRLDASLPPAAAQPPVEHQRGVPPLARAVGHPPVHGAANGQPGPDAGAERHHHQVVDVSSGTEPQLRHGAGLERVVDVQRQAQPPPQVGANRHVAPVPVRREPRDTARALHLARQADPDAEHIAGGDPAIAQDRLYRGHHMRDHVGRLVLLGVQLVFDAAHRAQAQVVQLHVDVRLGDVDTDQRAPTGVDRHERTPPAAARIREPRLGQQAQLQQLADRVGHGGETQARVRRDIVSRRRCLGTAGAGSRNGSPAARPGRCVAPVAHLPPAVPTSIGQRPPQSLRLDLPRTRRDVAEPPPDATTFLVRRYGGRQRPLSPSPPCLAEPGTVRPRVAPGGDG